jgi:Leucine-rich repeat (LRR) protein
MPKLQKLDLSGCKELPEIDLDCFDNLTSIILSWTNIKKLELKLLPKLQKLDLSGCKELPEFSLVGFDNLT